MDFSGIEWANLLLRWTHVIAAISWVGQTYLFNWMEAWFKDNPSQKPNTAGEIWMVHGGGFYVVEKQMTPEILPKKLYWFKWESALTWISGFFLFVTVFYMGGALLDMDSELSESSAIILSLGSVFITWLIYDILWNHTPMGRHEKLGLFVTFCLYMGFYMVLKNFFTDRASFFHVGALMGTIMAANVWRRILPAQNQMLKVKKEGGEVDPILAFRAGRCSKHNTFMSVPVVLIMISGHYPSILYGSPHKEILLAMMIVLGAGVGKLLRKH